jgi:hypothetical protein
MERTVTLYRPVGPQELDSIRKSGWTRFPPRLPGQPIFYPVIQEEYAKKIARDWNAVESGAGYVTRFHVRADYLLQYEERIAGGRLHTEYWIPAEKLDEFNNNIVGMIEIMAEYHLDGWEIAYDLANDNETIALVQRATLTTKDFGLVPDVALFGSDEWWAAVKDGRIPRHEVHGLISRVFVSGHNDWPEFELNSNGAKTTWTRMGNQALYVEGREAKVEYVLQRPRKISSHQEWQKMVLRVLLRSVSVADEN